MSVQLPEEIVLLYKERLNRASTIAVSCLKNEDPNPQDFDTLLSLAHKLAGTSGYFNDSAIEEASRKLEKELFKHQSDDLKPDETFLLSFQEAISKSDFFN